MIDPTGHTVEYNSGEPPGFDDEQPTDRHTPGPWRVEDLGDLESVMLIAGDVHTVNYACVGHATVDMEYGIDYVQMTSNARLMAAAPDLLAALRPILADPTVYMSSAHRAAALAALALVEVEPDS